MSYILDALKKAERERGDTRVSSPTVVLWIEKGRTVLDTISRILNDFEQLRGSVEVAQKESESLRGMLQDFERTRGLAEELQRECNQLRSEVRYLKADNERLHEERKQLAQWFTTVMEEAASRVRTMPAQ